MRLKKSNSNTLIPRGSNRSFLNQLNDNLSLSQLALLILPTRACLMPKVS